jgi:hypothetical protein
VFKMCVLFQSKYKWKCDVKVWVPTQASGNRPHTSAFQTIDVEDAHCLLFNLDLMKARCLKKAISSLVSHYYLCVFYDWVRQKSWARPKNKIRDILLEKV